MFTLFFCEFYAERGSGTPKGVNPQQQLILLPSVSNNTKDLVYVESFI
jgi:hypothetical protein